MNHAEGMSVLDSRDTRKAEGLQEKIATHEAELNEVEKALEEIERLEKIVSGVGATATVLQSIEGGEEARDKMQEVLDLVKDLIAKRQPEVLIGQRRELKLRIEQAKLDASETE